MKTLFLVLLLCLSSSAFSQKTPSQKPPSTVGTSDILKTDKRLADFTIKKTKFNVYLGYQKPDDMLRQEKGDTLQVYKITRDKLKFSHLEITKYGTRVGKIILEGNYKLVNDTLIVSENGYDYIGSFAMTTKYVTDKWGLKKVSEKMVGIKPANLTEKHLKPAEMNVPSPSLPHKN